MSRILASVLTAVLALCVLVPLLSGKGRNGFAVVGIIAIGILWAVALWRQMPGGLKVPLLIVFSIMALVSVIGSLVSIGTGLSDRFDRPRSEAPIVMGGGSSSASIAIVYHPGGSGFTKKIVTRLGEDLAARGYAVSIMTAHPGRAFDQKSYRALILASPVYGGEIRPPLKEFVDAHSPLSLPVFAILAGWFAAFNEADLQRLSELASKGGANLKKSIKLVWGGSRKAFGERIASFADVIDGFLKGTGR
jgi:hypothetical protein